jgi:hypothetical protein
MNAPQDPPAFAGLEWPGDVRDAAATASWWPAVAVVLLAVAALWWWRARRWRAPAPAAAPEAAATALARLRALALPGLPAGDAAIAAFYAQLKALVRVHCRERFAVCAEASTSEELVRALPARRELAHCLGACDLVLFAARRPGASDHAASHAAAVAFASAAGGSDGSAGAEVA